MTTYQSQSTRVRQLFSTLAAVAASNPVLLEGEKWNEKDATTGRATGRTKTGDGVVSGTAPNQTITGTAFNDLPFDPSSGGASLSDATPQALGTAAAGTASTASRSDHRHAMPTAAGVGADATGTAAAAVAAHAAAADPHPTYTTAAEAAAAAPVQSVAGRTGAVTLAAADVSGAVSTSDFRLSDAREWSAATVTQTEAETGSSTARLAFTPLRVFQAIAAWWAASASKTKLDGIAAGATVNSSDATLLARANHTGTQAGSTVTGAYTAAGMTMATARILGRSTAATGAAEEITIGSGLTLSAGALTATGGGSGTVTSVGLSLPGLFSVTGSPVTTTGTLTATLATQSPNLIWAGPGSGVTATAPAFRALVAADLPTTTVTAASYGSASSVSTFTVDASGRLTAASSTSIAIASGAVSGLATVATSGSASDLGAGTLPAARLPATTVTAASYTYGSFTVDAAGRLTAASNGTAPISAVLTGYVSGAGAITATDTVLSAIQKLNGNDGTKATAGAIGSSGLTMATATLLGRSTAATGAPEEITIGTGLSLSAGTLTATGGGGGQTPGGSTTQIQYNNAGAFAGATNAKINSNNLQLTAPGSTPAAADASSVVLYPASMADRFMLAMRGPTGAATLLQPAIFSSSIMFFSPQSGTVGTGSSAFQTAWTSNGTVSHPSRSAGTLQQVARCTAYANVVATQNQQMGPRMNNATDMTFLRGSVAGTGGFFFVARFRSTQPASTVRIFAGLQGNSGTASICISDAPAGPYCGLQHITTDPSTGSGALSFVTHDGTTRNALPINLTSDLVSSTTQIFDFMMYCPPNGSTIFFRLDELDSGVSYTNSTSANLPAASTFMSPQCQTSNGTANVTVNTVFMNVYKIYVESAY